MHCVIMLKLGRIMGLELKAENNGRDGVISSGNAVIATFPSMCLTNTCVHYKVGALQLKLHYFHCNDDYL